MHIYQPLETPACKNVHAGERPAPGKKKSERIIIFYTIVSYKFTVDSFEYDDGRHLSPSNENDIVLYCTGRSHQKSSAQERERPEVRSRAVRCKVRFLPRSFQPPFRYLVKNSPLCTYRLSCHSTVQRQELTARENNEQLGYSWIHLHSGLGPPSNAGWWSKSCVLGYIYVISLRVA